MIKKIKNIIFSDFIVKKIIAYTILAMFLYFMKGFAMLFLITFLFAYLSFYTWRDISKRIKKNYKIKNSFVKKLIWINAIVTYIYIFMIFWFVFFISHLVPILINEVSNLAKHIPIIEWYTKDFINSLNVLKNTKDVVSSDFSKIVNEKNISLFMGSIEHVKNLWWGIFKMLIAFILSYFFVIDRKRLHKYLEWIKWSLLKFLYEEYNFLFKNIAKWFVLIFRAQAKIAIANTVLTYIWIIIINLIIWQTIPYMWILIFIVFVFSFVPVLWVIISSLPIMLIAYNLAWITWALYVVIMICLVHAFEAYILNPRFVSEEVELPVSLTFLILIVWEYIFWPIWLIIAVPIFYISIQVFWDLDKSVKNNLQKSKK